MRISIKKARKRGEQSIGRRLSDKEFNDILAYATMKADGQKHARSYIPLLLPDVIRERECENASLKLLDAREDIEKWAQMSGLSAIEIRKLQESYPEIWQYASIADLLYE